MKRRYISTLAFCLICALLFFFPRKRRSRVLLFFYAAYSCYLLFDWGYLKILRALFEHLELFNAYDIIYVTPLALIPASIIGLIHIYIIEKLSLLLKPQTKPRARVRDDALS